MIRLIILLLGICPLLALTQPYTLPGSLTLQNSGNEPVSGAEVSALWANDAISDEAGDFQLTYTGKQEGYETLLKVEKEGYEVVNREELLHTLTANQQPVKFYLCSEGEWERNAMTYYGINEENLTLRYRQQIEQVKQNLADQETVMWDSLARLEEQYRGALAQVQDLSERFAKTNLDDATDLYEQAFQRFKTGDIAGAIDMLTDTKLEDQYRRIQAEAQKGKALIAIGENKLIAAEKAIEQGIKNYLLKADLLVIDFRFDEAETNFRKAVSADTTRFDSRYQLSMFLGQQNRFTEAVDQLQKSMSYVGDSLDKADVLRSMGSLMVSNNQYEPGMRYMYAAESIYRSFKDASPRITDSRAFNFMNLGASYVDKRDYEAGIPYLSQALELFEALPLALRSNSLSYIITIYANLGNAYSAMNQLEKADSSLFKAFQMLTEESAYGKEAYLTMASRLLASMGVLKQETKELEVAVAAMTEAIKVSRELATLNPEKYLNQIAQFDMTLATFLIQKEAKDLPAIEALQQESLEIAQTIGEMGQTSYADYIIGRVYVSQAELALVSFEYNEALSLFQKGTSVFKALCEVEYDVYVADYALSLLSWSRLLGDMGLNQACKDKTVEVEKLFRMLVQTKGMSYLYWHAGSLSQLGIMHALTGDPYSGMSCIKEALEIYEQLVKADYHYMADRARSTYFLGLIYSMNFQHQEAIPHFEDALREYESIRMLLGTFSDSLVADAHTAELADVLRDFGIMLTKDEDPTRGINYLKRALSIEYQIAATQYDSDSSNIAKILENIGVGYYYLKQYERAQSYAAKSVRLYRNILTRYPVERFGLDAVGAFYSLAACMNKNANRSESIGLCKEGLRILAQCPESLPREKLRRQITDTLRKIE